MLNPKKYIYFKIKAHVKIGEHIETICYLHKIDKKYKL